MEILDKNLEKCVDCKRLKGYVDEKYNGRVRVFCYCDFLAKTEGLFSSPSILSTRYDDLMWTPTTDHIGEDGEWGHTPHFAGFGY